MGRKYRDAERNNMGWGGPLESHLRKRIQPGELFTRPHSTLMTRAFRMTFMRFPGLFQWRVSPILFRGLCKGAL
jgi:hypothetical protein